MEGVRGSTPLDSLDSKYAYADLAQQAEHFFRKEGVAGSIPAIGFHRGDG